MAESFLVQRLLRGNKACPHRDAQVASRQTRPAIITSSDCQMKIRSRLPLAALVLLCLKSPLCAQVEPDVSDAKTTPARSEPIRIEIARLICQKAVALAERKVPDVNNPTKTEGNGAFILPPFTITTKRPPKIPMTQETPVEAFYRTGTIAEHVGKKITTRFWFSSAKGFMLSFDF